MNFIICNKLQHRGTDFELLGREKSTGAACKTVFYPSPHGSAIKKVVLRHTWTFFTRTPNLLASTSWLLCYAASAIWGILASFIQNHKAGIGIQNLAKKHCINASCIFRVPEGSWHVHNSVSQCCKSKISQYAETQPVSPCAAIWNERNTNSGTLIWWFLQNVSVASKHSGEEKKKLHKLSETAHREFLHLITPICRD